MRCLRPAVVSLAGGTAPLGALRPASATTPSQVSFPVVVSYGVVTVVVLSTGAPAGVTGVHVAELLPPDGYADRLSGKNLGWQRCPLVGLPWFLVSLCSRIACYVESWMEEWLFWPRSLLV